MKRLVSALTLTFVALAAGCASPDLAVDTPETGVGQVTTVETLPGANAAVYAAGDKYEALRFGRLNVNFVEIDAKRFVADWNDLTTYQSLKAGDKVGFSSTGRLIRLEGTGAKDGNYRQIFIRKQ